MTPVIILCGGYGLRIKELSETTPKPLIPIGGIPIIRHIINYYLIRIYLTLRKLRLFKLLSGIYLLLLGLTKLKAIQGVVNFMLQPDNYSMINGILRK